MSPPEHYARVLDSLETERPVRYSDPHRRQKRWNCLEGLAGGRLNFCEAARWPPTTVSGRGTGERIARGPAVRVNLGGEFEYYFRIPAVSTCETSGTLPSDFDCDGASRHPAPLLQPRARARAAPA